MAELDKSGFGGTVTARLEEIMADLYFKRIPLHPTLFELDVWVCAEKEPIGLAAGKMYGQNVGRFIEEMEHEMACWMKDKEGTKRILMFLQAVRPEFVAHEAVHVTWRLADFVGFKYSAKNDETQAYFVEYIVRQIMSIDESNLMLTA